jgi:hypothetical protein
MGFHSVVLAQTSPSETRTRPGIVLVAAHAKTHVFDIQLKGLSQPAQAQRLDALLLSKQGILSAETNVTTQVCRVEVLKKVTESQLRAVVEASGLQVAKTFNP